jgi:plasmid replication initiation protein
LSEGVDNSKGRVSRGVFAQGNELVNASYTMPVACHRLVMLALARLKWREEVSTELFTVVVTASDYRRVFESGATSKASNAYRELAYAANTMQTTKSAVIRVPVGGGGYVQKAWFEQVVYLPKSGCIVATFSAAVRPHITNLIAEFTVGELSAVSGFKSKHSFRLYMLLRQFKHTGFRVEDVEELQERFGVSYKRFPNFKVRVLAPALKELEQAGIKVRCKEIKQKQRVVRVEFTYNMVG